MFARCCLVCRGLLFVWWCFGWCGVLVCWCAVLAWNVVVDGGVAVMWWGGGVCGVWLVCLGVGRCAMCCGVRLACSCGWVGVVFALCLHGWMDG